MLDWRSTVFLQCTSNASNMTEKNLTIYAFMQLYEAWTWLKYFDILENFLASFSNS